MRRNIILTMAITLCMNVAAETITSPDGRTVVNVDCKDGQATYCVDYDGRHAIMPSALGLNTNIGNYTHGLTLSNVTATTTISDAYKTGHGTERKTSNVFALATAVMFQSPVQHFALTPGNLTDAPSWAIDFMKQVPVQWADVRFIDGYPGHYVVLARKSIDDRWYITGINGTMDSLKLRLPLPMLTAGQQLTLYCHHASKRCLRSLLTYFM